jgi:hypothetical protein
LLLFKRFILVAFGVLILANVGTTQALAMVDHSHHHKSKSVTPFKPKMVSLHCLLKGHSQKAFCPDHSKPFKEKKDIPVIGCECGGSPFPINHVLANSDFTPLEKPILHLFVPNGFKKATPLLGQLHSATPDAVKLPPKIS